MIDGVFVKESDLPEVADPTDLSSFLVEGCMIDGVFVKKADYEKQAAEAVAEYQNWLENELGRMQEKGANHG